MNSKLSRKWVLAGGLVAWLAAISSAAAADVIKVSREALYLTPGVGNATIRRECEWTTQIVDYLVDAADERVEVAEADALAQGKTLTLYVTSVQAFDKRRRGQANWAHLRGELKNNGQIIGTFEARTKPSIANRAKTCKVLQIFAEELGELVAQWTKKPRMDSQLGYWRDY
jgi:hypothetical protein